MAVLIMKIDELTDTTNGTVDLYQIRADKLKDKAKDADDVAKARKQRERVGKARENLHNQQSKLAKDISS